MPNMIEIIKKAAVDAVDASNPAAFLVGTVLSVEPLSIYVEQRLTLYRSHLILSSLVSDFDVDMAVDYSTEDTSGIDFQSHHHEVIGTKKMRVNLGLKVGESVMLLRVQGGQKFIVFDRVR